MKFAILIEDYNLFYTKYLENNTFLDNLSYNEKISHLLSQKYYQADSLAQALVGLGHKAEVIIPECNPLQLSWAKENNKFLFFKWNLQKPWRSFKSRVLHDYNTFDSIRNNILIDQLKIIKPDIIFVYSTIWIEKKTIDIIKPFCKKIILQWSCPITGRWKKFPFNEFDFIVSSSQSIVNYFTKNKINSYYWQQAFDDEILSKLQNSFDEKGDVVFIGNFTEYHSYRFEIIEYLLKNKINIDIYGTGKDTILQNSLLQKVIKPPLNGIEMFEKYKKYKIAIHIYGQSNETDEIDWSSFAGAKRNFEITGIGTALLTSFQKNLEDLFSKDEIISFKTKEECLEKINYYLSNPDILYKISKNGEQKTLSFHTFKNRASELLNIINL